MTKIFTNNSFHLRPTIMRDFCSDRKIIVHEEGFLAAADNLLLYQERLFYFDARIKLQQLLHQLVGGKRDSYHGYCS